MSYRFIGTATGAGKHKARTMRAIQKFYEREKRKRLKTNTDDKAYPLNPFVKRKQ